MCIRDRLRESEIPYRVISTRSTGTRMLTSRQRVVFDSAMNEGYWDSPRRITLSALAELLNVSKSTLSVQLHKIEGVVLNSFADEVRRNSPWTCSCEHVRKLMNSRYPIPVVWRNYLRHGKNGLLTLANGKIELVLIELSLIHIWRCRRSTLCRSRWSPYH